MTVIPPFTNNVYTCRLPPTLTRWRGHVPVAALPEAVHSWEVVQPGGLSVVFWVSWLTARCGVCFRRIMFPLLTTALSSPGDLYNCTECEPDVPISMLACVPSRVVAVYNFSETSEKFRTCARARAREAVQLTEGCCALVFLQDFQQEVKQLKSKVEELEGEKSQYERKLRATKVLVTHRADVELSLLHKQH